MEIIQYFTECFSQVNGVILTSILNSMPNIRVLAQEVSKI